MSTRLPLWPREGKGQLQRVTHPMTPASCTESSSRGITQMERRGWGGTQNLWAEEQGVSRAECSGCQCFQWLLTVRTVKTQCPLHSTERNSCGFYSESHLMCFRGLFYAEMNYEFNYILYTSFGNISIAKAPRQMRYIPSCPTILLFRNHLHIHPHLLSDTRLLPQFHLSQDFAHKSLHVMTLEWIFKQFDFFFFFC